jgi:hypothetical protein
MNALLLTTALLAAPAAALAAVCSTNNPEPFGLFIRQFSSEPAFALKRTILPLEVLRWEYGINERGEEKPEVVVSWISKHEYAKWAPLDGYMKKNGLTSSIESQSKNAAALKIFKDGTDWQVVYRFKLRKGCWFLRQFEDESL